MQTACVISTPLGFVCGSPSNPTQYPSQSPFQQKSPQISSTPRNGRRRSARNSVQIFLSSVIQYATADPSISSSSSSSPSPSRVVEFKKRDMTSTTAQDYSHPQISLLSEMLQRQMIGGIGNCTDSRTDGRGIRFDCGSNGSKSVSTPTASGNKTPNNVSQRKCLKFGVCPSVLRQPQQAQQPRQPATILTNTNETETTQSSSIKYVTPVKTVCNDSTLISGGNELVSTPTKFKKLKHLSPPPAKSLYLSKVVEANDSYEEEEEEEEKDDDDDDDDDDDEDGYLEDDEEDDDDDEEEEEEEEDDDGEELTPQILIPSFDSTTRQNTKVQMHPTSIVETTTSSEQEQTTTTTSSHYSTALSLLTPPNNVNRQLVRKAKSLPYRVTSTDTTSNNNWDHRNVERMSPLAVRRRKLGVKSIPIPKNHFHEPCYHNTHKRRHGHQKRENEDALWNDIISRMAGVDKSNKEDKEEEVLWPLSI